MPIERNRSRSHSASGPFRGVKQVQLPNMDYAVNGWLEADSWQYFNRMKELGLLLAFKYEPIRLIFFEAKNNIQAFNVDWQLVYPDGSIPFSESKGWFDPRSRTTTRLYYDNYPEEARETIWIVQSAASEEFIRKTFKGDSALLKIWRMKEMKLDEIGSSFEWWTPKSLKEHEAKHRQPASGYDPTPF